MSTPEEMAARLYGSAPPAQTSAGDMSSRLYGATTPPAPAPPASEPVPADTRPLAERIYAPAEAPAPRADVPPEIAALRAADMGRRMYSAAKDLAQALPDGALEPLGFDSVETREIAVDLGMSPTDLRELGSLASAVDDGSRSWHDQTATMIADQQYTQHDLDQARRLVARDPRVKHFLDSTGLGDHPKLVERFIQLARSAATRPKAS